MRKILFHIIRFLVRAFIWSTPPWLMRFYFKALFSKSRRRFDNGCSEPLALQRARLMAIVQANRLTAFGQKYNFSDIKTIEDYQQRVPISDYSGFEPYIARMLDGEGRVLVTEHVDYFGQSSGTTGPAKYIPVTESFIEEFKSPRRVWMQAVGMQFPRLLRGAILSMSSPKIEGYTKGGTPYGSISRRIDESAGRKLPDRYATFPRAIYFLEDFDTKYYTLMRLALDTRISMFNAVNPSTIILFCQKMNQFALEIIQDIETGTLKGSLELPPGLRALLEQRLKPNPKRAAFLRKCLAERGYLKPTEVWKQFCGVLCWKGGSASFYLQQFPKYFDDLPVMDYGFVATEGYFSIPLSGEDNHGVLSLSGHFMEFIPEEERDQENPPVLTCDKLEVGKRYHLIVTASNGLYRYDINDIIEVVGLYHNTPEVVFLHKGGNMLSVTGEKVGEFHVVEAVTRAARSLVPLVSFAVTVEMADLPRYLFSVEVAGESDPATLRELLHRCDAGLRRANIEYEAKRSSERLGDPALLLVKPGWFEAYRAQRVAEGAPDAHVKPPHLKKDPAFIEQIETIERIEWA